MAILNLGNGRYALRWRDARGKRHYQSLPKMPYAKVKQLHAEKIANRNDEANSEATILRICLDYIELHGPTMSPEGRVRAHGIVKCHVKPDPIGSIVAADLRTSDVKKWRNRRKNDGASDATLDREWSVVQAALNEAARNGEPGVKPLPRGSIRRLVKSTDGRIIYFLPEEWRAFISALDDEERWCEYVKRSRRHGPMKIGTVSTTARIYGWGRNPDSDSGATQAYRLRLLAFRPIFTALLWTGCRLSEIRLLRWEDVDLRNMVVRIPQTKTGNPKSIPMAPELHAELSALPRGVGRAYVFPKAEGRPYLLQEVQRAFKAYRKAAGLREELSTHAIRHTVASWLVIAGRPIKEVQEILGHRTLAMTLRYVHLAPIHLMGSIDAIRTMMASETTQAATGQDDGQATPR